MPIPSMMVGIASYLLPLALLAMALPRRERHRLRAAAFAAMFCAYFVATGAREVMELVHSPDVGFSLAVQLAMFCGIILIMAVGTWACRSCTGHTATFCAIAAYTIQNLGSGLGNVITLLVTGGIAGPHEELVWVSVSCLVLVTGLGYLAFIRPIARRGLTPVKDRRMLAMVGVVVFFDIAFDIATKRVVGSEVPLAFVTILLVSHVGVCVLILYLEYELLFSRSLVLEQQVMAQMMRERERQYQESRSNIEAINVKCHDIRHQIRSLGGSGTVDPDALADIAREVNVYDATFDTGNDALDTILTEKALVCEGMGIRLTAMADGSVLESLSPAELYALFGNMLDNAIEAVAGLGEEDRVVSLAVRRQFGMAGVHMENRFEGRMEFEDGLPRTHKPDRDNHGFGMRSMRAIVTRHGGTLSCRVEDGVFFLNVLIPIP